MPPDVYLLALAAAVCWGVDPVLAKRGLAHGGTPFQAAAVVLGVGACSFWGVLVLLHGGAALSGLSTQTALVFLFGGLVGSTGGRIAYYLGVDRVGASVAGAGIATQPAFTATLGVLLLGEGLHSRQIAGIGLAVFGLAVLARSRGGDKTGWRRRDLVLPVIAAAAFGLGHVARRYGLTETPTTILQGAALNDAAALAGILGYLLVVERGSVGSVAPRAIGYFALTGAISAVGVLLLFAGLDAGAAAVVGTLVGTAALFTALFSYLLLGDLERVTWGVVSGAVIVVAGVGLLASA